MDVTRIDGSVTVAVAPSRLWDALRDPELLERSLPGCRRLEMTGPDTYAATVDTDVASLRGAYRGTVRVTDLQPPTSYRLTVDGAGTPGGVRASATVRLEASGDGTTVHYDGEAAVSGTIGRVGQGLLVGVAQRNVADFFAALERELTAVPAAAVASPDLAAPTEPAVPSAAAPDERPDEPAAAGAVRPPRGSIGRAVAGAGVALVGAGLAVAGVALRRRLRR